jgi:hypothetical protein
MPSITNKNRRFVIHDKFLLCMALLIGLTTASLMTTASHNRNDSNSDTEVKSSGRYIKVSRVDNVQDSVGTTLRSAVETVEEVSQDESFAFESLELEHLSSPFKRETVLELNAIVARSLAAIQAYDLARRKPLDGDVSAALGVYERLSVEARQARADIAASGKRIRESGEEHNRAILAAMVRFVDDVDKEIRESVQTLRTEVSDNEGRDS